MSQQNSRKKMLLHCSLPKGKTIRIHGKAGKAEKCLPITYT